MVAEQAVDSSAFLLRLLGELADMFDDFYRVRPTIRNITGLNQVGFATGPFAPFVN